ncbi:MAG: glycosyltransferase family 4 protein [Ferruginibacter sp.]
MKVLWLASWFPNRTDPFNGDFVERHAYATAPFTDKLFVIAVIKDEHLRRGKVEIVQKQEGNLFFYRVYYGKGKWGGIAERLFSFKKYYALQKKVYTQIVQEHGQPEIVHVHVPFKAGVFAMHLKQQCHIPYIVTEHWAGYDKNCVPSIYDLGRTFRRINTMVLKAASLLLPVSDHLGKLVTNNFAGIPYQSIPNVADTSLFYYKEHAPAVFRFIHPSYMNYQKNPEGILAACKILADKGCPFELLMVGNDDKRLQDIAAKAGLLNKYVFFRAAVPYAVVAELMQESSALLLFSRFENLPCVIIEALCTGLPVISTAAGGIPEIINDTNGILVENENIEELANAMQQLINNYNHYDRKQIAAASNAKFSYDVVGKQYGDVYDMISKNK